MSLYFSIVRLRQLEISILLGVRVVHHNPRESKFRCGDFGLEDEKGRGPKPSVDNDKLKTLVE